jgi:hypothetical protein
MLQPDEAALAASSLVALMGVAHQEAARDPCGPWPKE